MPKDTSKPRGRVSSYAYFLQKSCEDYKKKNPNKAIVFSEFSKQCSTQWKKMSDSEKKKYIQMADRDKKRYQDEMKNYVPPKGEKGRKSKKNKKDPAAPKRALSAFFLYCQDERNNVKSSLPPESSVGDVAKELGRKWKLLNGQAKAKYEQLAIKEKAKYDKEMTAYKAKGSGGSGGGKAPAKSKKVVESSDEEDEEESEEEEEQEESEEEEEDDDEDDE